MKNRKIKKDICRIGAGVMAGLCLLTTVAQAATTGVTSNSQAPETTTEAMTRSEALAWVQQKVVYYGNALTSELAASTVDTGQVMIDYGCLLVYLNWAAANALNINGVGYTVFEGMSDTDLATAKNLIDLATSIRSTIKDKNILSTSYNATTLRPNQSMILTLPLPSGATVFNTIGTLHNTTSYTIELADIIQCYVDANILMLVGNENDAAALKSISDYSSLAAKFGEEENASAAALTYIGTLKDKVLPYVKVYQGIYAAFTTANGKSLKAESIKDDAGTEHAGTPIVNASLIDVNKIFKMSTLSKEICNALTETTSDTSLGTTTESTDTLKVDNGAMPLLSNMCIQDGELQEPDDGDPELTSIGYRILAAGICYDPLVSQAGNDFFMEIVMDALSTDDQQDKVNSILLKALSLKKPLYVTSQKSGQWDQKTTDTSLNATEFKIAYLADMLNPGNSEGGNMNLFVIPKGKMSPTQSDSSTCDYYLNGIDDSSTDSNIVEDDDTTISVAGASFQGSSDTVTQPVAATTKKVSSLHSGEMIGVAGLTSLILNNVVCDLKGNKYIDSDESQELFMNGLGDIVLLDGTIVLPAIANPMLYKYDTYMQTDASLDSTTHTSEETAGVVAGDSSTSEAKSYYPYNAAFCNHYPDVSLNGEFVLNVSGGVGKYMLSEGGTVWRIKKGDKDGVTSEKAGIISNIPAGNSLNVQADSTATINAFPFKTGDIGHGVLWWTQNFTQTLMVKEGKRSSSGINIVPMPVASGDTASHSDDIAVVSSLVTSCVRYISSKDAATGNPVNAGTFDVARYLREYVGQTLMGTQRAEVLAKNFAVSYENIVNDTSNRFEKFLAQLANKVLDTFGDTDGVLAIKGPYENGFFTNVIHFVQKFYPFFAVLILIILARSFVKGRASFLYVALVLGISVASLNVYAYVLPDVLANAYNVVVNDVVEKTSWTTMMHASENYAKTYGDADRRDSTTGDLRPYTSTITLYQMTDYERDTLAGQLGIEADDIESGTRYDVDPSAGIFVQGNRIKQSVDLLFANNAMRGLYATQWEAEGLVDGVGTMIPEALNNNPYTIQLEDPYISLEAYYTPFCHIERSFLTNLNQFANIFNIERQQFIYGDGVYKDAFIFSAFINSGIFTAPCEDSVLKQNISYTTSAQEILSTNDVITIAHQYFDPQEDWLNLRSFFGNPSTSLKNSLWGKMLQKQEYYDSDWKITEKGDEKFSQLISYVNNQTKLWIINNQDELVCCSDENAIKLTALFATTAFNHKVSQISNWLYPNYIDASPFVLRDVLYGSMTSSYDKNFGADGDVTNTVLLNLGIVGLVFLITITFFSAIFIFVLTYMIPILYALLGLMIIYRLSNSDTAAQVVTGYIKVTAVSILSYIVFAFAYRLIEFGGYQWYGYLLTLVLILICCGVLFTTVAAVLLDPLTLGDTTLKNTFMSMLNTLTKGTIGALTANALRIRNGEFNNAIFNNSYEGYSRGMSLSKVPLAQGSRQMRERYGDSYRMHSPLGHFNVSKSVRRRNF